MLNRKIILWSAVLVIFLSACSSRKKAATTSTVSKELSKKETKILLEGIESNQIAYQSFSTKARTKLNVDNKSFNATLNIRIKNKEAIWISANAFLGIEAARILITPD